MLGRHVYRVHLADDRWAILKEGETTPRGTYARQEEALAEACRLADADQPSRVTVDNGDGIILDDRHRDRERAGVEFVRDPRHFVFGKVTGDLTVVGDRRLNRRRRDVVTIEEDP